MPAIGKESSLRKRHLISNGLHRCQVYLQLLLAVLWLHRQLSSQIYQENGKIINSLSIPLSDNPCISLWALRRSFFRVDGATYFRCFPPSAAQKSSQMQKQPELINKATLEIPLPPSNSKTFLLITSINGYISSVLGPLVLSDSFFLNRTTLNRAVITLLSRVPSCIHGSSQDLRITRYDNGRSFDEVQKVRLGVIKIGR